MTDDEEFQPIGNILPGVLKDISRRVELRLRLEAEHGRPINDETFLNLAGRDGVEL